MTLFRKRSLLVLEMKRRCLSGDVNTQLNNFLDLMVLLRKKSSNLAKSEMVRQSKETQILVKN